MTESNQGVPSRVGATFDFTTPMRAAFGYPRRSARMAGVAMTVSPIRFGQKTTTLFMALASGRELGNHGRVQEGDHDLVVARQRHPFRSWPLKHVEETSVFLLEIEVGGGETVE